MNDSKFLGRSIVIAAVLVASALCFHVVKTSAPAKKKSADPDSAIDELEGIDRYQFHPSNPPGVIWIIDTVTGKVTSRSG